MEVLRRLENDFNPKEQRLVKHFSNFVDLKHFLEYLSNKDQNFKI